MRRVVALFAVWLASTLLFYVVYSCAPEIDSDEEFSFPRDLEELRRTTVILSKYRDQKFTYTLLLFSLALLYKQTFAIPGSFFMNLLGGALFGSWLGVPLVCLLTACGASCCFLLSHFFARSLVDRYLRKRLHSIKNKIAEEREHLFFFLLSARVFPFTPHWLLNITSPFVGIPLHTHFATVGLGLIPYNFLCVRAGCILSEIRSASDVFDVYTMAELLFTAVVLFGLGRFAKNRSRAAAI